MAMEASVCGGIPIHAALREGICGDRVETIFGILNGTCNYILTTMEASGRTFADVLAEAQKLGYAEADPAFDIGGMDVSYSPTNHTGLNFVDLSIVSIDGRFRR